MIVYTKGSFPNKSTKDLFEVAKNNLKNEWMERFQF